MRVSSLVTKLSLLTASSKDHTKNHRRRHRHRRHRQRSFGTTSAAETELNSTDPVVSADKPSSQLQQVSSIMVSTLALTTQGVAILPTALQQDDGTKMLHAMLQRHLPSYHHLVSYQRGQMRLEVFVLCKLTNEENRVHFQNEIEVDTTGVVKPPQTTPSAHHNHTMMALDVQVLNVSAQNTGRAGLANKGGIVTELLIERKTRLSFCTAHLEAHEGRAKYKIRCATMADILAGTRKAVHDVSMSAHYCFYLGDLNFRTELPEDQFTSEEDHKQKVMALVEQGNWEKLNEIDELRRALQSGDCLVGFQTPFCNFPPTFKVERQVGYQYVDKRRPSYTDRILWKTGHELDSGIRPLLYEPINNFATSDHKPVRGAFLVSLNQDLNLRPRLSRRRDSIARRSVDMIRSVVLQHSTSTPIGVGSTVASQGSNKATSSPTLSTNPPESPASGQGEKLHLFVSQIKCHLSRDGAPPSPFVVLVSYPQEALKHEQPWWSKALRKARLSSRPATNFVNADGTTSMSAFGYPRSSVKKTTFEGNWEDEEIHCIVRTHDAHGAPLNLAGAMLGITVADNAKSDAYPVIGTFCFNLAHLIQKCHQQHESIRQRRMARSLLLQQQQASNGGGGSSGELQSQKRGEGRRGSLLGFLTQSYNRTDSRMDESEDFDPVVSVAIDERLLKNGRQVGRIQCEVEAWYMSDETARKTRALRMAHSHATTPPQTLPQWSSRRVSKRNMGKARRPDVQVY